MGLGPPKARLGVRGGRGDFSHYASLEACDALPDRLRIYPHSLRDTDAGEQVIFDTEFQPWIAPVW